MNQSRLQRCNYHLHLSCCFLLVGGVEGVCTVWRLDVLQSGLSITEVSRELLDEQN